MIGAVMKRLWLPIVVIVLLGSLVWAVNHYRDNATTYKEQRDKATEKLNQANDTIDDMKVRQRDVAALDATYTGELADAKKIINQLERDVAAGRKRLHVNARCPANGEASTGRLGNATTSRLTDAAERDYFTLRERIEIASKQIKYLEDYILTQCLR